MKNFTGLKKKITTDRPVPAYCLILIMTWFTVWIMGCNNSKTVQSAPFLIKVRDRTITVDDFKKSLEIAKTAYFQNDLNDPVEKKRIRLRLLNQMTEEMILLEKAEDLKIDISEAELEAHINEIKKDYPDNTFEETLLENAVSFETWKKHLKTRLIMEAVINHELESHIQITPQEVADYYEKHYKGSDLGNVLNAENEAEIETLIRKSIRREKAEAAYVDWIKTIQNEFVININKNEWNKIIGS